jgi:hypothetical protein
MREFDALPAELRAWLAQATRPWSPRSALRLWRRALAQEGCPERARSRLDRAEAATLQRTGEVRTARAAGRRRHSSRSVVKVSG